MYEELEFYIFRILELQKWNPLNDSFAHGVEKFVSALKSNYDDLQNSIRELTKKVHEKEFFKSILNYLSRIADSDGKPEDKISSIQKILTNSKTRSGQALIEDEDRPHQLIKKM